MEPVLPIKHQRQDSLADHYYGQAHKKQHIRATLKLFKRCIQRRFLFAEVTPNGIHQRLSVLPVVVIAVTYFIGELSISPGCADAVHDVLFKLVTQLSFVHRGRILGIEISVEYILIEGQKDIDIPDNWISHRIENYSLQIHKESMTLYKRIRIHLFISVFAFFRKSG